MPRPSPFTMSRRGSGARVGCPPGGGRSGSISRGELIQLANRPDRACGLNGSARARAEARRVDRRREILDAIHANQVARSSRTRPFWCRCSCGRSTVQVGGGICASARCCTRLITWCPNAPTRFGDWSVRARSVADKRRALIADLLALDLDLWRICPLAVRSWGLRRRLTSYDASYVALAENTRHTLATLDSAIPKTPGHGAFPLTRPRQTDVQARSTTWLPGPGGRRRTMDEQR